jgi:hypothetical protein
VSADDPEVPPGAIDWVERFHAVVDEASAAVTTANRDRLRCRAGCSGCCVDALTVFAVEAAVIRRHHGELLRTGAPHPDGACAFLDAAGGCRIYAQRPYVCRTQGLPLRWVEEDETGDGLVESRDICPLNADTGPALEELEAGDCWTLGPFEERLAAREAAVDGGRGVRLALRTLFARTSERRRLPVL